MPTKRNRKALLDLAIRRQVLLERIKAGQYRDFAKVFPEIEKLIQAKIGGLANDLAGENRRFLARWLGQIEKAVLKQYGASLKLFNKDLEETAGIFAAMEAGDIAASITGTVTLSTPTARQAFNLAKVQAMSHSGETLEQFVESFAQGETKRVVSVLRRGFFQGRTNQELVREILGTRARRFQDGILNVSRRNAQAVVFTSVQHVASVGRMRTWQDNADVVKGYEWVSTLDRKTTQKCKTLDGQKFKVGEGPVPPVHIRCLLPGTLITSTCGISKVFKRAFKGKVATIKTRSGNVLTVTPNHPILTNRGWVSAELVDLSDQCFVNTDPKSVIGPEGQDNAGFATIEQIAESFGASFDVRTMEVPTASPDFHNDGVNNEVANVMTKPDLLMVAYSPQVEHRGKLGFILGDGKTTFFQSPFDISDSLGLGDFTASCGLVSFADKPLFVGLAGSVHPGLLLGSSASKRNSRFQEGALNGAWTDAEYIRDSANSDSFGIKLDDVVSVEISDFCGHVYNLETDSGLVNCNGVVTHNCRSTTVADLDPKFDFLKEGRTRSGEKGPVDAKKDYYDWLKDQPPEFQDQALGPKRAKLFREGGLSADKFAELQLDRNFEPLTLAEMRALEPEAFKNAGL